ncbi:MAG: hypothetical protein CYPHOPRED_002202 [Cyphobasidiales sp. Tagirdzhanova-0007]|nr:MAG: hypothetical protein CYPHOPRED_002202 [Cyphobasidiales sp. Tagirdzhanova-0007]
MVVAGHSTQNRAIAGHRNGVIHMAYMACLLPPQGTSYWAPKVLFKDVLATRGGNTDENTSYRSPLRRLSGKTPARQHALKPAFKSPGLPSTRTSKQPDSQQQTSALCKTPSSDLLNRRKRGGASLVNLDYNGLVKPTSLRTDLNANSSHQIGIPPAHDSLQARLDETDEE